MNDYNNFSESYSNPRVKSYALSHSPLTAWRRQAIRALQ